MSKIFVAGATGRVGQEVVKQLAAAGQEVLAAGRKLDRLPKGELITPVAFDFTWLPDQMAKLLTGVDAIVFTAGSRGKNLLQVDLNGAVKLMQAANLAGIKRFVMLSSAYSMDQAMWGKVKTLRDITDYNIARYFADKWLVDESGLDYTLVQAGILTEEPGTGKIELNPAQSDSNAIPDVAHTIVAALAEPATVKKAFIIKKLKTVRHRSKKPSRLARHVSGANRLA